MSSQKDPKKYCQYVKDRSGEYRECGINFKHLERVIRLLLSSGGSSVTVLLGFFSKASLSSSSPVDAGAHVVNSLMSYLLKKIKKTKQC